MKTTGRIGLGTLLSFLASGLATAASESPVFGEDAFSPTGLKWVGAVAAERFGPAAAEFRWEEPYVAGNVAEGRQHRQGSSRGGTLHDLLVFYEVWEFDEITFEFDGIVAPLNTVEDVDVPDVERRKVGLKYRVGKEDGQFVVSIFAEEIDEAFLDEVGLIGIEIGAQGVPRFLKRRVVSPILDYEIALSFHGGEGDDFFDEFYYAEARGHLGLGVEAFGVQATAGVAASALAGVFNTQSAIEDMGLDGDQIEGANVAGFLRIGYRAAQFPLFISVQGFLGDIEGAIVNFGVRF